MLAATSLGATSKDLTANAEAVTAALARNGQPTPGGPMGSRARKHERRLPRSVAKIDRAFRSYTAHKSLTWRRSVEDASWQDPAGHIHRYKAKILPDTIVPGKACVFFVTEARGERLPHDLREKPYEVSKLCQGGRSFTGMIQMADRQRAKQLAHDKAYFEKHDRYPPRHR